MRRYQIEIVVDSDLSAAGEAQVVLRAVQRYATAISADQDSMIKFSANSIRQVIDRGAAEDALLAGTE